MMISAAGLGQFSFRAGSFLQRHTLVSVSNETWLALTAIRAFLIDTGSVQTTAVASRFFAFVDV